MYSPTEFEGFDTWDNAPVNIVSTNSGSLNVVWDSIFALQTYVVGVLYF